jgi:hypothetical protein
VNAKSNTRESPAAHWERKLILQTTVLSDYKIRPLHHFSSLFKAVLPLKEELSNNYVMGPHVRAESIAEQIFKRPEAVRPCNALFLGIGGWSGSPSLQCISLVTTEGGHWK